MATDDRNPEPEAHLSDETDHALLLLELEDTERKIENAQLASRSAEPGPAEEEPPQ